MTRPFQVAWWQISGAVALARVLDDAAVAVTQAAIASITRTIFDLSSATPETAISGPTTLVVADSIFDTLQTDAVWTKDTTGYNFRDKIPDTAFPDGGKRYRVDYRFTPSSGSKFTVAYEGVSRRVYAA